MLFLNSYPPVPLSTWKGGTHRFGFSSYEGAAATADRRSKRKEQKNRLRVFLLFSFARFARRSAPGVECVALPE